MPGKLRVIGYTAIMNLQAKKVTFVAGGRWQTQSTANQRKVTFNHRRILTLKCLGDYNWVMNLKKKPEMS
ncbi:hypothetical protein L9H89_004004 [Klebsiella aerogenes]|nr:hypothetical protein [Klebsiella aerogenes]